MHVKVKNVVHENVVTVELYLKSCQLKLSSLYHTFVNVHVVIQTSRDRRTDIKKSHITCSPGKRYVSLFRRTTSLKKQSDKSSLDFELCFQC